jgi:hypothetical protein
MVLGTIWGFFILTAFLVISIKYCCCRTHDREQEQQEQQQQQQLQQQDQQENQQSELTEEAKEQERRLKILINIIHKKVLPKQESNTNDDNKEDIYNTSSLLLPHEKSLSRRASLKRSTESFDDNCNDSDGNIEIDVPQWFLSSTVIQSQPNHEGTSIGSNWDENIIPFPVPVPSPQSQLEEEEESNGKKQKILKNNIFEQSMRSLRKVMGIQGVSNSSLYSPKVCPICMEPYKAGDEIAWSKNEECHHAFHLDCILNWLMNNDECPMCRGDYLCTTGSDCEA